MENNELKKVRIKYRRCYYFNDIIKLEDFDLDNILIDQKSHENILIYDISYEASIGSKPLRIRFEKIDGIIRIYDRNRYLTLFGTKTYDTIYDKVRYHTSIKSGITCTLKCVTNHLKTKKMGKHAVKKLIYLLRYVPDQQICDKTILESGGTLNSVPDCCKNQEMCNKAVENYPHALEFVPECYKTQNMRDKVVNSYASTIKVAPECLMGQKMCDKGLINTFLNLILFLINIKLKKFVTLLFLMILL